MSPGHKAGYTGVLISFSEVISVVDETVYSTAGEHTGLQVRLRRVRFEIYYVSRIGGAEPTS